MNRNLSRRIIATLAGPAVATGILAGTLAVSAPAEAAGPDVQPAVLTPGAE